MAQVQEHMDRTALQLALLCGNQHRELQVHLTSLNP